MFLLSLLSAQSQGSGFGMKPSMHWRIMLGEGRVNEVVLQPHYQRPLISTHWTFKRNISCVRHYGRTWGGESVLERIFKLSSVQINYK